MKRKIVILAEKKLGPITSKLANGAIRYLNDEVVAVIDSTNAGKTVQEVLKFGGEIPIYASIDETMSLNPNALLIGVTPPGGKFPSEWYPLLITALQNRLNIISGLQDFLYDIVEFRVLAEKYNVKITDLRKFDFPKTLVRGIARNFRSKIVLTIGTHENVGKLTTLMELVHQMQKEGNSSDWLATGQAGILIKGKGVPVDTIMGNFISGTIESAIAAIDGKYEYVFVEGQGSIQHLGYSAMTMGIMHGSLPDAMILCHRSDIGVSDYGIKTDHFENIINLSEKLISIIKPTKIVGISLNTYHLNDTRAGQLLKDIEKKTGLITTDPLRFGVEPLTSALKKYFKAYKKRS